MTDTQREFVGADAPEHYTRAEKSAWAEGACFAHKAALAHSQKPETAWLVEKKIKGFPHYLYATCTGLFDWTPSSQKAMRFARREDADMICNVIDDAERVAEHMWCEAITNRKDE